MGSSVLRSLHALQQAEQELRQHQTALESARKALQDMSAAAQEHARSANSFNLSWKIVDLDMLKFCLAWLPLLAEPPLSPTCLQPICVSRLSDPIPFLMPCLHFVTNP